MQKRLKIFLPIVLASCALGANLTTQEQKESYSIGASTGSYVSNQLHSQAALGVKYDLDAVIEGFLDALKKQQKLKDEEIIALLNQRADKLNKIVETNSKAELDKNLKEELDLLCDEIGITVTTAFTIFAKKFVRERRLPFTVDADPFYSQKNLTRLKKSIEQLENKGGTIHEITEVLDD